MSQTHLRLNLAIRRNGLPEAKVVWPVPLEENPTVSKLLEQVNDIIPLESSDWGLEDYAVELAGPDGSSFECLHFQLVRTVLKEGDHVRIRPLLTNDLKQRRHSGRHQISSDGKHLIDGIPFGRPLLKAPRGRPSLDIPPRKRRRVAIEEGPDEDSDLEEQDQVQDNPMLLLTNGEENHSGAKRVTINTEPQYLGKELDDEDDEDSDSDFDEDQMDEESDFEDDEDEDEEEEEEKEEGEDQNEDLESEEQDSAQEEDESGRDEEDGRNPPEQPLEESTAPELPESLSTLDGPSLLRTAFPKITVFCDNMLQKCGGNLDLAYKALRKISEPALPRDEFQRRTREQSGQGKAAEDSTSSKTASEGRISTDGPSPTAGPDDQDDLDDDEAGDDEAGDDVDDFVKKFDHRGLPAGSISTAPKPGKNHIVFEEETEPVTSTTNASTKASLAPKPTDGESDDSSDSHSESSDSGSDSDSNSDSGPEETTAKRGVKASAPGNNGAKPDSDSDSSSFDEDSSDSSDEENDEEHSDSESSDEDFAPNSGAKESDSTSESDSDSSSSDSEPEEESSRPQTQSAGHRQPANASLAGSDAAAHPSGKLDPSTANKSLSSSVVPEQPEVPPGSGKQSTKQRNARRRLAARSKRMGTQATDADAEQAGSTSQAELQKSKQDAEKELFEAKRKALLDALNSGGAVIGPDGELEVEDKPEVGDTTTVSQKSNKRRRGERSTPEPAGGDSGDKSVATPASQETDPDASAQKRRRVDLGAGRRMLFGALGLRNPKTKDDESQLRAKLMENVRPLPNARLETNAAENAESLAKDAATDPEALDEDPDAWREKIEYRAVECWYEGVDLSEPPFPFEQRWDPQQRRNGPRKAKKPSAETDTTGHDQEEETSFAGKKRKHDESVQMEEDSYYSYQGQAGSQDENLRLNYDDVEPEQVDKTDNHQTENSIDDGNYSDLDDLPSLPKDLGVLRQLHPGQARVGMVVTWKQFILSEAVSWQPQVLDLTGLVTEIYGDDAFEVILAKRDRHLENPEKQYDEHTGKRIYGRFEAPDDDDEADDEHEDSDEENRRKLSFSVIDGYITMMEPKIRQDPMDSVLSSPMAERRADVTMGNSADEVAKSGEASGNHDHAVDETSKPAFETTMDSQMGNGPAAVDVEEPHPSQEDHSVTNGQSNSSNGQPGQGHRFINVPLSDISQITSSSQRVSGSPEPRSASHQSATDWAAPSSDGVEPDLPDGGPTTPTREQSSVPTTHFNDTNGDILTGTPKSTYPKVIVRPSSASSEHSGRQPDFATTTETPQPNSLKDTTEGERGRLETTDQQQFAEREDSLPPAYSPTGISSPAADVHAQDRGDESDASFSSIPSLSTALRESSQKSSQFFGSQQSQRQSQLPPDLSSENEEFAGSPELPEQQNADEDSNIIPDSFQTAPQSKPNIETSSMAGDEADRRKMLVSSQDQFPAPQVRAGTDISPPPVLRKTKSTSPFVKQRNSPPVPSSSMRHSIPPGTQVVEISSDSSDEGHSSDSQSEHFEDHVIENDGADDETWNPDESTALPDGSGWVQKKRPEKAFPAKKTLGGRKVGYHLSQPARKPKSQTAASVYRKRVKARRNA
ncbi:clumping factor b protein [Apiospora arundinis]|uniref:Clumping factor b protein n=1 Tax=Apiospora arundinis TaxID=335852 RepID=A0ABR2JHE5_9PEZI